MTTYSVEHSDVTEYPFEFNSVKTTLYETTSPIQHCISQSDENIGDQGYWVSQNGALAGKVAGHSPADQLPIEKTLQSPGRCFPVGIGKTCALNFYTISGSRSENIIDLL